MRRLVSASELRDRPRRRRLRSLAFAPTLITLGNLVCGFGAIHFAMRELYEFTAGLSADHIRTFPSGPKVFEGMLPSYLSLGAFLILVGMFLDAFDGLVARMTRSTTTFGGQLDSLADVITFGAAPATLMVAFMTRQLAGASPADSIMPSPISDHPLGRLTWIAAALYVSFTAIRLARFNVEHAEVDHDHRVFHGLPSPGAASILVAIIFFQDQNIYPAARNLIVYATPAITAAIAILMVSRIPYKRFYGLLGRQPFHQVTILLLILAFFWVAPWKAPMLLLLTLGYGLSGPIQYALRLLRDRTRPAIASTSPDSVTSRPTDKDRAI